MSITNFDDLIITTVYSCDDDDLTPSQYMECLPVILSDVMDVLYPIFSVVVAITILFVGVRLIKQNVNAMIGTI